MKTAVVYASKHHRNTEKVLRHIAKEFGTVLIDAGNGPVGDLSSYDIIGFASGIDNGHYYPEVLAAARKDLPAGKKVFFFHTAGAPSEYQSGEIRGITERKGCITLGTFCCKGFDSSSLFLAMGGINKGYPTERDCHDAVEFCRRIFSC